MFILRTYQWNYYWRNLILIVLIRLLDDAKNIYLFSASTINCEILYICSAIKKRLFLKIRNILALLIKKNNLSYGLKYVSKKTSAAPAWAGISLDRMERIYYYSSWK